MCRLDGQMAANEDDSQALLRVVQLTNTEAVPRPAGGPVEAAGIELTS